ncbi:MAG: MaoC/PaaZ C-terminal domain-containing protein [Alphaproteobacteria bacterium]
MADAPFTLADADGFVGRQLAVTDWVMIDQVQTNVFGEVTRWPTWMHCDPERCKTESPYGGTLLHGFMAVSLLTHFVDVIRPPDGRYSLNYGLDKVRVLRPVMIGDGVRLRDRIILLAATDKGEGRKLLKTEHLIEADDGPDPAVYAEYLNYWYPTS